MARVTQDAWRDRLVGDGVAIFLFHGVVRGARRPVRNYTRKHLPEPSFRALIDELGEAGSPVSMDAVLAWCRGETALPERAFAITFDDGFLNNATIAAPILEAARTPATFYITTGFVDDNAMSWIDRLECLFESVPSVHASLPWRSAPVRAETTADRIGILDEIRLEVKQRAALDVDALVRAIHDEHGAPEVVAGDDELDRKLTWDDVRTLHENPLFTIGGHTHRHPILSFLDDDALEREIALSFDRLDAEGIGTRHYSYPEGMAHCFDERVIAALRRRGIACCPTAMDGVNRAGADPFRLRRIAVT